MDDEPAAAVDPSPSERRYANHLRIGFNRLEFLLDFAQAYDGRSERVHTQLVSAPAHVKQFVALLHGCVNDYEQRYGAIDEWNATQPTASAAKVAQAAAASSRPELACAGLGSTKVSRIALPEAAT